MNAPLTEARPSTTRRPSLVACLVFAACAAIGAAFWVAGAASFLGCGDAAASCALALVVLYPLFVAPSVERGVAATLVTAMLAVPIACVRPAPFVAFIGMPVLLGLVRSTLLYPQALARALILEARLAGAGLGAMFVFYDGGLVGTVFALWTFWLIQAGFALRAGETALPTAARSFRADRPLDPFDSAHEAALAILKSNP